jgi:glycosyltransferase involved in cell wall biosynthesis
MGIAPVRIRVIPHATPDPLTGGRALREPPRGGGALYVGRLSHENGLDVLIDAWRGVDVPLRIAGTGPLEAQLRAANRNPNVIFLGHLSRAEVMDAIEASSLVVLPHRWLEPFGLAATEAFALGRPVVCSNLGGPAGIVESGVTGTLVPPEDPRALREAVLSICEDSDRLRRFGRNARRSYERHFHPLVHLRHLEALYRDLVGRPCPAAAQPA